ncbi:hypothetical protein [Parvibium lacunae]|uniref:Uncharacterized protein n=1 Tax=Parvibium lacunae TaxID=1888893 RepID=A0A368L7U8_9BURK|nr:hypothetical protein [Parvibium lacunae]RCS59778.1 hypothetical protein DU000_03490 [Parvibium lacunae]
MAPNPASCDRATLSDRYIYLRPVIASLTAPIAALLPLLALAVYEFNSPVAIINGEADDAPTRGLASLLVAFPVIYVILALVAFFGGWVFIRIGLISLRWFLVGAAVLSVLLAVPFGIIFGNPGQYGLQGVAVALASCSRLFLFMALPGAICWWYVAKCHLAFRSSFHPSQP